MPRLTSKAHRLHFGARVRQLRQARGLTQQELAERTWDPLSGTGRHDKWVGAVERGEGNPTLDTILSLADALEVEPAELFSGWPPARVGPCGDRAGFLPGSA